MTVYDAVAVLMTYVGYGAKQIDACMNTLKTFDKNEGVSGVEGVKSIRFDNDLAVVDTLKKQATNEYRVTFKDLKGTDGTEESYGYGIEYSIHTEKGYRYALVCKDIPKSIFLRIFTDAGKYNRFKGNNKITVSRAFDFNGFALIEYRSEGSTIVRHAMLIDPNAVCNLEEVRQKFSEAANATHLFG